MKEQEEDKLHPPLLKWQLENKSSGASYISTHSKE